MTPTKEQIEAVTIPAEGSLDIITVFWQDFGVGQGNVTIICWGAAWTCYFGGMGGNTIREFFSNADVGYLVNKLGNTQWLKASKKHDAYLGRLIVAVKQSLKEGHS